MKSIFEKLVEEQFASIKKTTRLRYPRQIKFSPDFLESIKKEYYTQVLSESPEAPLKNRPQKFMKALQFVVTDLVANESTEKIKYQTIAEDTEQFEVSSKSSPKLCKPCCDQCKASTDKILDQNVKKASSDTHNLKKLPLRAKKQNS